MAAEKKVVVDASVVVKWFLNEVDSAKALELLDAHIAGNMLLIIPDLAFIEVMNVLRYKGKSIEELAKANRALWDLQLHVEKTSSFLLEKAAQVALKYDFSFYDALYVALAGLFGVPLITADKDLQKAPNVVLL